MRQSDRKTFSAEGISHRVRGLEGKEKGCTAKGDRPVAERSTLHGRMEPAPPKGEEKKRGKAESEIGRNGMNLFGGPASRSQKRQNPERKGNQTTQRAGKEDKIPKLHPLLPQFKKTKVRDGRENNPNWHSH